MGIDSRVSRTRQIEKINRKKLKLKLKLQKEVKLVSSSRKKQLRQYTVYAAKNTQHLKCDWLLSNDCIFQTAILLTQLWVTNICIFNYSNNLPFLKMEKNQSQSSIFATCLTCFCLVLPILTTTRSPPLANVNYEGCFLSNIESRIAKTEFRTNFRVIIPEYVCLHKCGPIRW